MKKLIIFLILAFAGWAHAAELPQTLRFAWEQAQADMDDLDRWELHWSDIQGSGYVLASTIPYDYVFDLPAIAAPFSFTVEVVPE